MGIWAEIKHALNNTLGTTSFKPLNTIITDHTTNEINRALNEFHNSKSLSASDEVFYTFPDTLSPYLKTGVSSSYEDDLCEFTMPLSGSMNLQFKTGFNGSSSTPLSTGSIELVITKNGVNYKSLSTNNYHDSNGNALKTLCLEGERGDVFRIKVVFNKISGSGGFGIKASLYSLNATVKESESIRLQTLV